MEDVTVLDVYNKILEISYEKQLSHIGSNISVAPILYDIYFKKMKEGDIVVLSKGHASTALYAVLILKGITTLEQVYKNFCGHITTKIPGVYWSTGSLGHGYPIAIGAALASPDKNVFVVLSDGELDEGSTMEAIKYVDQQPFIKNLIVFIDNNGFSATKKVLPVFMEKWETYNIYKSNKGKPILPPSMTGLVSHYAKLTKEKYEFCLARLKGMKDA